MLKETLGKTFRKSGELLSKIHPPIHPIPSNDAIKVVAVPAVLLKTTVKVSLLESKIERNERWFKSFGQYCCNL